MPKRGPGHIDTPPAARRSLGSKLGDAGGAAAIGPRSVAATLATQISPYGLLYGGMYDAAAKHLDKEQRARLQILKWLEVPDEYDWSAEEHQWVVNLDRSTRVTDHYEVYRGYSAETEAELDAIEADPKPFQSHDNGNPKGGDQYDLLETYPGTYVTRDKARAREYATRHDHGLLVTFDWRELRALYVLGHISFELSNDIAFATGDFANPHEEDILGDLRVAMPKDHPVHEVDAETISDEDLVDILQDPEYYIPWAFLFGRNKELAISGIEDWPMSRCKSTTRVGGAVI